MVVSDIQLYELLKGKIGAKEAEAFVEILDRRVDKKFEEKREVLATKQDIADMQKTFYFVSVGQFLAIVGSILAIMAFMGK